MMSDAALELGRANDAREARLLQAITRSNGDRDRLARLVRQGIVLRDPRVGHRVDGASAFRADIERRVRPVIDLAIRPKKKRRR